jgi:beta-galactosidase
MVFYNILVMKRIALVLSAILCISVSFGQKKPVVIQKSQRIEIIVNSNWTFNYFPGENTGVGYESPGTNDLKWMAISLPHTWSTYETTGELHPFIRNTSEEDSPYWWTGWGWYRKHFTINKDYSERKVFIEFEGVQKYCKVWLNGKYLGEHKGGYGSFDFDITQLIKQGGDNVIAVAVNNRQNDNFRTPPMSAGIFNVYGGINRDVKIVLKNKLYIPMQGSASHEGGTFVTTPGLKEKEGVVRVQTWVKNDNNVKKSCTLRTTVFDESNKTIEVIKSTSDINPGQLFKFDQLSKPLKNPHLWSNENPYLYRIFSEVIDGNDLADSYTTSFGFRWIRWNFRENSLFVNGKKMVIKGGGIHSEYPWLGDAFPKWVTALDFKNITENLNYNFLRTSGHPSDKYLFELADKTGVIIEEESPSISDQDFSPEMQEQQIKEMIRRDRNHPSVIFWNLGNGTNRAVDSKYATDEDTTRFITARYVTGKSAGAFVKLTEKNMPDAEPLTPAVRGWYNSDVKDVESSDISECGTEEQQQKMMISGMKAGNGNIFTMVFADFGSGAKFLNSPLLNISPTGIADMYRIPKYSYFCWQANYSKNPVVFIQPHFWRTQYIGQRKDISVISNCEKVELKVNGVSKGILIPDETNLHSVVYKDILIEKGTLTASGTYKGVMVTTQVVMAGEPAKIILKPAENKITADKGSVLILTADIVDFKGNRIYGATNSVKWTVSGPATFVGPENYETGINKHEETDGVWYMDMPVTNVLRSTGMPGKIHVTVSASGLASGSLDIDAEKLKPDNSVITEPLLENEGRKMVTRLVLNPIRLDELPREIKLSTEELKLTCPDKPGYIKAIREYIVKNNQSVDSVTVEFRSLTAILATYLINNNGILKADDYNFSVDHFNNCRLLAGYINATKLPPLYKDGLRKYYSNSIIVLGNEKNAGEEMNWLNWIPSGGTVVIFNDGGKIPAVKGAVMTPKNDLPDLIALVYPSFVNFSDEARERALLFISKANPYIKITSRTEPNPANTKEKITRLSYKAEKGQPVLIPLLKFIQE